MNPKIKQQAFALLEQNKLAEAIPLLVKITRKNSNDLESWFALASAYAQTNQTHDAEQCLGYIIQRAPDNAQAYYALAYLQESNKQYVAALDNYHKLLTLNPGQADIYNHLGNIYLIQNQLKQAENYYRKYIKSDPNNINVMNNLAVVLTRLRNFDDAREILEKIKSLHPSNLDASNNLGILYMESEQYQDAEQEFSNVLDNEPNHIRTINNLGNLYKRMGDMEKAARYFEKALSINPEHAEAKYNWATVHIKNKNYTDAISLLKEAIKYNPKYSKASLLLSETYLVSEQHENALHEIVRCINQNPNNIEAYQFLAKLIQNTIITETSEEIENILNTCLDIDKVNNDFLIKPVLSIVMRDETAADITAIQSSLPKTSSENILDGKHTALFRNKLFQSLIRKTVITDFAIEEFLSRFRNAMLQTVSSKKKLPRLDEKLDLICSVAMQCYNTEYVYTTTPEEESLSGEIISRLSTVNNFGKNDLARIAIACMYHPLHEILSAEQIDILKKAKLQPSFQKLIIQQVVEPLLEREKKSTIKSLSPEIDQTSKGIMDINEDAPYPRWISTTVYNHKTKPGSLFSHFHLTKPETINHEQFNMLIAGCGTGKHSIEVASNYSSTHVTAVDISYNSLGYAMRKTEEYGISNLDYYHADLLNISNIDKQYDMIDVSGVLHHFDKPAIMLNKLVDILKPGGLIKIGVYSKKIRNAINGVQKEIIGKYEANATGIRDARQFVINNYDLEELTLNNCKDFHTLSGCRYLLFGANDNSFTIDSIKTLLEDSNLVFAGFETESESTLKNYKEQFPDDPDMLNLDHWDEFETLYPKTFINMYQFICQKPF